MTFNNTAFSDNTIDGMTTLHPSVQRLYQAAKDLRDVSGQSAVARLLGATPQVVKNWEARGISNEGALLAQKLIGCNANWLLEGIGPMRPDTLDRPNGVRPVVMKHAFRVGVVQGGDNGWIEDCATPTAQEPEPVYYASTLHDERAYAVKVRGSSMEPAIMAGWDVVASPSRPAEPPDLCVVYFADGRKAIKRLAWVRGGMVCLESTSAHHEKITEPTANIVRMDKVISIVPN